MHDRTLNLTEEEYAEVCDIIDFGDLTDKLVETITDEASTLDEAIHQYDHHPLIKVIKAFETPEDFTSIRESDITTFRVSFGATDD